MPFTLVVLLLGGKSDYRFSSANKCEIKEQFQATTNHGAANDIEQVLQLSKNQKKLLKRH